MRRTLPLLAFLALSACQPRRPEVSSALSPADGIRAEAPARPDAAVPPAPSGQERKFAGEFNVRGTEPFWAVDIRGAGLTVQRPDRMGLTVANPGVTEDGDNAVWSTTAGGQALVVKLSDGGNCSDGMSDVVYRYSAVVILGSETLRGCAFKLAEKPEDSR